MTIEKLDFSPTKNPDGTVSWTMCVQGGKCSTGPGNYPSVDVNKGNADVKFELNIVNDHTGMGIKFDPTNPIWIQDGIKPTAPVIDTQIYDITGANLTTLKFTDANCNKAATTLKYRLNFVDSQGKSVKNPVDPDIRNGGSNFTGAATGGISQFSTMELGAIAVAFVVGFVVAMVIFRQRAPTA